MSIKYTLTLNTGTNFFQTHNEFISFVENIGGFSNHKQFVEQQMSAGDIIHTAVTCNDNIITFVREWNTQGGVDSWLAFRALNPLTDEFAALGWSMTVPWALVAP